MARNIVGTLIQVGKGKLKRQALKEILLSKDRESAEIFLKIISALSDYTDYLRLHRFSRRSFNLCNLLLIF